MRQIIVPQELIEEILAEAKARKLKVEDIIAERLIRDWKVNSRSTLNDR